jgi:hypothetical protein
MERIVLRLCAWMIAGSAVVGVTNSQATTFQVCASGCAFTTIQSAVDAAHSNDGVLVAPGRYEENVTVAGKTLFIGGNTTNTGAPVLVVGTGRGPVFTLGANDGGPYYEVELALLTISGGAHSNGTGVGGGIQVRQGAFLRLLGGSVASNTATMGGGIGVNTPGGPTSSLEQCSISTNSAPIGGGLYVAPGSTVSVQQCTIQSNLATGSLVAGTNFSPAQGGGVYAEAGSQLTLNGAVISLNSATAVCTPPSSPQLACGDALGGGLYVKGAVTFTSSDITGNEVNSDHGNALGAGLYVVLGATQSIQSTIFSHNVGFSFLKSNGGGIFAASSNPAAKLSLDLAYVVENEADDFTGSPETGGIYNQGTLVVTNSTFKNNQGPECHGGSGCP